MDVSDDMIRCVFGAALFRLKVHPEDYRAAQAQLAALGQKAAAWDAAAAVIAEMVGDDEASVAAGLIALTIIREEALRQPALPTPAGGHPAAPGGGGGR